MFAGLSALGDDAPEPEAPDEDTDEKGPPPNTAGIDVPADDIPRLRAMIDSLDRVVMAQILDGKLRSAKDGADLRKNLVAQLADLEDAAAQASLQDTPEAAQAEILEFLTALDPADPFLTEVRRVLGRKAVPKGTICRSDDAVATGPATD